MRESGPNKLAGIPISAASLPLPKKPVSEDDAAAAATAAEFS